MQQITPAITPAYPDLLTHWALDLPDSIELINAFNSVDTVAIILLQHPQLLACARSSGGWRADKSEERQVLAIADAELAMRAILEVFHE